MADDTPSLSDRMAAARAAWQHDVRINRGPAPAEAPAHVPQFISPFRAFEVMQVAEFHMQRGNSPVTVQTVPLKQTPFATIEEARQAPGYAADFWTLYGRKEDGTAQAIGDFKTEDMARDVLGGITGDRKFDQHPAQDWTLAVGWSKIAHDVSPPDRSLAERMSEGRSGRAEDTIAAARRTAETPIRDELADRLPPASESRGTDHYTQDQHLATHEYFDRTENRPNEQILGPTRQRW